MNGRMKEMNFRIEEMNCRMKEMIFRMSEMNSTVEGINIGTYITLTKYPSGMVLQSVRIFSRAGCNTCKKQSGNNFSSISL